MHIEFFEREKLSMNNVTKKEIDNLVVEFNNLIKKIKDAMDDYIEAKCDKFTYEIEWETFECKFQNSSKKVGNDKYKITLYLFAPYIMQKYLKTILMLNDEQVNEFLLIMLANSLYHEFFHIAFGHCTIPKDAKIPNDLHRTIEMMSDLKAIDMLLSNYDIQLQYDMKCIGNTETIPKILQTYASITTIIYMQYVVLESIEISNMNKKLQQNNLIYKNDMVEEKYKSVTSNDRDHPFITFRFEYIMNIIEDRLRKEYHFIDTQLDFLFFKVTEFVIQFGFTNTFTTNPSWRKNRKALRQLYEELSLKEMMRYVKICYIKEINFDISK